MNNNNSNTKIIAIVGPTACGKSTLAIKIAKILNSEIISADSMQVYKGMDIGTAKVDVDTRRVTKHHLIDITSIDKPFNAAKFQDLSRSIVNDLFSKKITPIIVGGTGLYVKSAIYDVKFSSNLMDETYRAHLEENYNKQGIKWLQAELLKKDKKAIALIDINNHRRIISALAIIESTKQPFADSRRDKKQKLNFFHNTLLIGLTLPREMLYEKINFRVDEMFEAGLLDETEALLKMGFREEIVAFQAIGYKELIDYFDKKCCLDDAIENIKKRTRNLAKRQLTWFRQDENIKWYDVGKQELNEIAEEIVHIYSNS